MYPFTQLLKSRNKVVITDYQLFDFNGHLRSLSDTSFESDERLYVSGKALLTEPRPTASIGPITSWELETNEAGDIVPVLFTENCTYHLGAPKDIYGPFIERTAHGVQIACAIVDFLEAGNRGAEYEDMILSLTTKSGISIEELFSEYFVIFKYLFLYDGNAATGRLLQTQALKTYAKLTGVSSLQTAFTFSISLFVYYHFFYI